MAGRTQIGGALYLSTLLLKVGCADDFQVGLTISVLRHHGTDVTAVDKTPQDLTHVSSRYSGDKKRKVSTVYSYIPSRLDLLLRRQFSLTWRQLVNS